MLWKKSYQETSGTGKTEKVGVAGQYTAGNLPKVSTALDVEDRVVNVL